MLRLRLGYRKLRWGFEDVVLARHRRLQGAERPILHFGAIRVEQLRTVTEFGVEDAVPFDSGTTVGGFAAHDSGERAVGDLLGFVELGIFGDRVDEVDVLLDIGVDAFFASAPHGATVRVNGVVRVGPAFGAVDRFADGRPIALDLAAIRVKVDAIGIFVFDGEVIPDFSRFTIELLTSSHAPAFDRVSANYPVADV